MRQEHKSSTVRAQTALLLVQAPTSGIYPGKKRKNGSSIAAPTSCSILLPPTTLILEINVLNILSEITDMSKERNVITANKQLAIVNIFLRCHSTRRFKSSVLLSLPVHPFLHH